jgi:glutamate racemase
LNSKPQVAPIGIFDSGYGGLTVLSKIAELLPEYDLLYLGDNARTPYGTRPFDVVYDFTLQGVKHLFDQGAQLVILACNTASAKALPSIQRDDLPSIDPDRRVLGVIRPSAEIVNEHTTSKHIGIFATNGTVTSNSYPIEIAHLHPELSVVQEACPMWVPLVESNEFATPGGAYFIEKHVKAILAKDPEIDLIVLGCTHYPILMEQVQAALPEGIKLLEQGAIVAASLKNYLSRHPEMDEKCSKEGTVRYCTTADPDQFAEKAKLILGQEITVEQVSILNN